MDTKEALARLHSLGTNQHRKIYPRHGVQGTLYGVSCADAGEKWTQHKGEWTAAKRIGKAEVDHGQTSCKIPDATAYIKKAAAHKKARA